MEKLITLGDKLRCIEELFALDRAPSMIPVKIAVAILADAAKATNVEIYKGAVTSMTGKIPEQSQITLPGGRIFTKPFKEAVEEIVAKNDVNALNRFLKDKDFRTVKGGMVISGNALRRDVKAFVEALQNQLGKGEHGNAR